MKKQFDVTGMTCAACSSRVEKAVSGVDGVSSCSVNLLTNSMSVEGDFSTASVIRAVEKAGYKASEKGAVDKKPGNITEKSDNLTAILISSLAVLIVLMYFSMGHMMLSLPVPYFLENNPVGQGVLQLLLSLCVLLINKRFFVNGVRGVMNKAPNMDTLVALGSGVSFLYSTASLFAMTYFSSKGDSEQVHGLYMNLYFETSAMIPALITVGKLLEHRSKGKTTSAIKGLMKLTPDTAVKIVDGEEKTVSISEIAVGDIFVIRSGDSIPADGRVIDGSCTVNEAMLTGESVPLEKTAGDRVSAGTVNLSGYVRCEATGVGSDTMLAGIIKTVSDASATKAPVAKLADKVAGIFVPAVLVIAFIAFIVWMLLGEELSFALARSISVLVVSCPCALGLATPVAIMVGSGMGAKHGILYKTAESLEQAGKVKIVALDKTGTVTEGKPVVTDIISLSEISSEELLSYAYAAEIKSEHPLARAICEKAVENNIALRQSKDFTSFAGSGIFAVVDTKSVFAGNEKFISSEAEFSQQAKDLARKLSDEGKTPVFFADNGRLMGVIAVSDKIKQDSAAAVKQLRNMGIYVVLLTGDNKRTAASVGKALGVDEIISDVLPEGKFQVIDSLCAKGLTAMVGDGINDAPALTRADVGIAIGAGSDIAIDSADIVLIKGSLLDAVKAIRLSRAVLNNIRQNLFWAFGYNIIGIPLAAGVFLSLLNWSFNPAFGAAAMSISSFLVVSNALRLNLFNISSDKKDRKIKQVFINQEEKIMTKTIRIEGMMCMHCEARVKKILEALDGVSSAQVSHEAGTAVVTLSEDVSNDVLTQTITAQDYKVIGIE